MQNTYVADASCAEFKGACSINHVMFAQADARDEKHMLHKCEDYAAAYPANLFLLVGDPEAQ